MTGASSSDSVIIFSFLSSFLCTYFTLTCSQHLNKPEGGTTPYKYIVRCWSAVRTFLPVRSHRFTLSPFSASKRLIKAFSVSLSSRWYTEERNALKSKPLQSPSVSAADKCWPQSWLLICSSRSSSLETCWTLFSYKILATSKCITYGLLRLPGSFMWMWIINSFVFLSGFSSSHSFSSRTFLDSQTFLLIKNTKNTS